MEQTMKRENILLINAEKYSSCIYGSIKAPGEGTGRLFSCGLIHFRRVQL
jgi:hypothetical protein